MKEIYDYKKIEKEVQDLWARNKRYEANIDTTKPKYYCLSMRIFEKPSPKCLFTEGLLKRHHKIQMCQKTPYVRFWSSRSS